MFSAKMHELDFSFKMDYWEFHNIGKSHAERYSNPVAIFKCVHAKPQSCANSLKAKGFIDPQRSEPEHSVTSMNTTAVFHIFITVQNEQHQRNSENKWHVSTDSNGTKTFHSILNCCNKCGGSPTEECLFRRHFLPHTLCQHTRLNVKHV